LARAGDLALLRHALLLLFLQLRLVLPLHLSLLLFVLLLRPVLPLRLTLLLLILLLRLTLLLLGLQLRLALLLFVDPCNGFGPIAGRVVVFWLQRRDRAACRRRPLHCRILRRTTRRAAPCSAMVLCCLALLARSSTCSANAPIGAVS
jgi:hypothetical protein